MLLPQTAEQAVCKENTEEPAPKEVGRGRADSQEGELPGGF